MSKTEPGPTNIRLNPATGQGIPKPGSPAGRGEGGGVGGGEGGRAKGIGPELRSDCTLEPVALNPKP